MKTLSNTEAELKKKRYLKKKAYSKSGNPESLKNNLNS